MLTLSLNGGHQFGSKLQNRISRSGSFSREVRADLLSQFVIGGFTLKHRILLLFGLGLFCILTQIGLQAQLTTATLYGTITDKTGATIGAAEVTARNIDTNFSRTVTTSAEGNFRIEFLPIGNYVLEVMATGFRKSVQKGIALSANQIARFDVALSVGNVSESVEVTGEAPLVETGGATIGNTLELAQLENLPLVDRNVYTLTALTPGVQSTSATQTVPSIVLGYPEQRTMINGGVDGGAGSVSYYLDGGVNMTMLRNTGNIVPNPDAIQEFRIETNNYKAEFGRFGSGVISIITKSGTNQIHGALFEYIRNTNLNAYSWGADPKLPKPGMHRNAFGGTIGGPIRKDKTFFFFNYSGLRMTQDTLLQGAVVPTALERTGDFSQSAVKPRGYTGGLIPVGNFDPVAKYILDNFIPLPNQPNNKFQAQLTVPYNTNEYLIKIDHALTAKHQLAGSYFLTQGDNANNPGGNMLWSMQQFNWRQQNINVSDTWMASGNKINQVWMTYTRMIGGRVNTCAATAVKTDACTKSDMSLHDMGSTFTPQSTPSLPQISVSGYFTLGQAIAGPVAGTNFYSLRDVFSYNRGRHAFKLGGEVSLNKDVQQTLLNNYGTFSFSSSSTARTGNALADFLLGLPSAINQDSPVLAYDDSWYTALFAQDDFRIHPRLMLNLGVRWDVQTPPTDPMDREATFVQGVQSTVLPPTAPAGILVVGDPGVTRGTIPVRWHHVSPRVGLAWDVFGTGKTSVRAGAGVFYGSVSGNEWNTTMNFQPFAVRYPFPSVGTLSDPYKNLPGGVSPFPYNYDPQNPRFLASAGLEGVDLNFQFPYTYQFNLSVQQEVLKDTSVSIAYVGALSHNLPLAQDVNYPLMVNAPNPTSTGACTGTAVVPSTKNAPCRRPILPGTWGSLLVVKSNQFASYHGLQLTLNRRMSNHFSINSFYTFSKTLTSVALQNNNTNPTQSGQQPQNYNNLRAERGRADTDMRHQFSLSMVWTPDYYSGSSGIVRALANGWSLSPIVTLRSGAPFAINTGADNNFDGITNNDRPNLVGDPKVSDPSAAKWFNTDAFVANPAGTDGNVPRNFLSAPGYSNVDLAISRAFRINERFKLTARVEALNAFNMVSLNAPNANVASKSNGTFGTISSAQAMRRMQFGLRLTY